MQWTRLPSMCGCDGRGVPRSQGQKSFPEGCVQLPLGLGSQYRKIHKAVSSLGFPMWRFFTLTFLKFSSMNQNAAPILKLEDPLRIPNACRLALLCPPPPPPQASWCLLWEIHRHHRWQQSMASGKRGQNLSLDLLMIWVSKIRFYISSKEGFLFTVKF